MTETQGLKWVGTPFSGPLLLQSGVSKNDIFFCGNARPQAGKIVLSMATRSEFEFCQDNGLTRNTGGRCKIMKGAHRFYRGPRDF